jgi:two-component system nitrate/nitrite response regulator NarL
VIHRSSALAGSSAATCVVADDHPAVLRIVCELLSERGIDVVAQAEDGVSALSFIEELKPTVAVLDLVMPHLGGIEVARRAHRAAPETGLVLYTGFGEHALLVEALDAGVCGFVLKEAPVGQILRAVTLAACGEVYVDPSLAPALARAAVTATSGLPPLSTREREILRLLADGKANEEIATALFIAPGTVKTYIRRAMAKLEADTRTQAVATALRQSLIA